MFAGNVYAETDLDQPTDYSLRYAEDDTEKPQTYCTEGTPYNFSTATSLSDLRSPDAANKVISIITMYTKKLHRFFLTLLQPLKLIFKIGKCNK